MVSTSSIYTDLCAAATKMSLALYI